MNEWELTLHSVFARAADPLTWLLVAAVVLLSAWRWWWLWPVPASSFAAAIVIHRHIGHWHEINLSQDRMQSMSINYFLEFLTWAIAAVFVGKFLAMAGSCLADRRRQR